MHIDRDGIYTAEEVCALFDVSLRTLQRAVQRGQVPGRVVGRGLFFVGSDLLDGLARVPVGGRRGAGEGGPAEDG